MPLFFTNLAYTDRFELRDTADALFGIKNGKFQNDIRLVNQGRLTKNSLAFYLWQSNARQIRNITKLSGLVALDFDGKSNEKFSAAEIRQTLFEQFPSVRAAWLSSSGRGVHAIMEVRDLANTTEFFQQTYEFAVREIGARILKRTGFVMDNHSKNVTQILFVSADRDLLQRETVEPEIIPNLIRGAATEFRSARREKRERVLEQRTDYCGVEVFYTVPYPQTLEQFTLLYEAFMPLRHLTLRGLPLGSGGAAGRSIVTKFRTKIEKTVSGTGERMNVRFDGAGALARTLALTPMYEQRKLINQALEAARFFSKSPSKAELDFVDFYFKTSIRSAPVFVGLAQTYTWDRNLSMIFDCMEEAPGQSCTYDEIISHVLTRDPVMVDPSTFVRSQLLGAFASHVYDRVGGIVTRSPNGTTVYQNVRFNAAKFMASPFIIEFEPTLGGTWTMSGFNREFARFLEHTYERFGINYTKLYSELYNERLNTFNSNKNAEGKYGAIFERRVMKKLRPHLRNLSRTFAVNEGDALPRRIDGFRYDLVTLLYEKRGSLPEAKVGGTRAFKRSAPSHARPNSSVRREDGTIMSIKRSIAKREMKSDGKNPPPPVAGGGSETLSRDPEPTNSSHISVGRLRIEGTFTESELNIQTRQSQLEVMPIYRDGSDECGFNASDSKMDFIKKHRKSLLNSTFAGSFVAGNDVRGLRLFMREQERNLSSFSSAIGLGALDRSHPKLIIAAPAARYIIGSGAPGGLFRFDRNAYFVDSNMPPLLLQVLHLKMMIAKAFITKMEYQIRRRHEIRECDLENVEYCSEKIESWIAHVTRRLQKKHGLYFSWECKQEFDFYYGIMMTERDNMMERVRAKRKQGSPFTAAPAGRSAGHPGTA
jgi:hypothetical protein